MADNYKAISEDKVEPFSAVGANTHVAMQLGKPTKLQRIFPLLYWLPLVNAKTLKSDLIAAFTGATIVLPQAIAFSAIAGLPPEYGFYTAIVATIIASLFGSSLHMVSGPTTAISALLFGSLVGIYEPGSGAFIQAALTVTVLAGIIQLALGIARTGFLVNFVSHSVLIGFTIGAAILIAISQIEGFFGFTVKDGLLDHNYLFELYEGLHHFTWHTPAIASFTLLITVLAKRYFKYLPYYVMALIAGTLFSFFIDAQSHGVALVGEISVSFPQFANISFDIRQWQALSIPALALALVGLLEAISISRAIATRSGQRTDSNQEFIGQGVSNAVGGLFSSYMSSGSFTRSGVNFDVGAKTPLAAIFAAIILLVLWILVAPLFAYVPISAISGIIMYVAWRLVDIEHIKEHVLPSKSETSIVIVSALSAVFIALDFAILFGVMLSLIFFLERSSHPRIDVISPDPTSSDRVFREVSKYELQQCPNSVFLRMTGSMYFGAIEHIRETLGGIERQYPDAKFLVMVMKGVSDIDLQSCELLVEEADRRIARGGGLCLVTTDDALISRMERFHLFEHMDKKMLFANKGGAIKQIISASKNNACQSCEARIFSECPIADYHPVSTH